MKCYYRPWPYQADHTLLIVEKDKYGYFHLHYKTAHRWTLDKSDELDCKILSHVKADIESGKLKAITEGEALAILL